MNRGGGLLLLGLAFCAACAQAQLTLSNALGSSMVLQRAPQSARLWGTAAAGSLVTVSVYLEDGRFVLNSTTTAFGTNWALTLPPFGAGGPYWLRVSSGRDIIDMRDVLFGDVWLCSGQSNMEMTTNMAYDGDAEVADSINYPNIRVFTVASNAQSAPVSYVNSRNTAGWARASPASIGGGYYYYFSAVCYFYGRKVYQSTGIPQGLIASSYGGTRIQAWMRPEALALCGVEEAPRALGEKADPNEASALWNGMIFPLLNMVLSGATWYQGESNAGEPSLYACLFPTMIEDWRRTFQADLFFYWVELAPYNSLANLLPAIRVAQKSALRLPNVGEASAIDTWDPYCPWEEIHPRGKAPVGNRLGLLALAQKYVQPVDPFGPRLLSAVRTGTGTVTLNMWSLTSQQVLYRNQDYCSVCCSVAPFKVRSATNFQWYNVDASAISGLSIALYSAGAATIDGVRYAYEDIPQCVVVDQYTLPMPPFEFYF